MSPKQTLVVSLVLKRVFVTDTNSELVIYVLILFRNESTLYHGKRFLEVHIMSVLPLIRGNIGKLTVFTLDSREDKMSTPLTGPLLYLSPSVFSHYKGRRESHGFGVVLVSYIVCGKY